MKSNTTTKLKKLISAGLIGATVASFAAGATTYGSERVDYSIDEYDHTSRINEESTVVISDDVYKTETTYKIFNIGKLGREDKIIETIRNYDDGFYKITGKNDICYFKRYGSIYKWEKDNLDGNWSTVDIKYGKFYYGDLYVLFKFIKKREDVKYIKVNEVMANGIITCFAYKNEQGDIVCTIFYKDENISQEEEKKFISIGRALKLFNNRDENNRIPIVSLKTDIGKLVEYDSKIYLQLSEEEVETLKGMQEKMDEEPKEDNPVEETIEENKDKVLPPLEYSIFDGCDLV